MNKAYRRWALGLTAGLLALLMLCAVFTAAVDPYFHYRDPDPDAEVYFDQRYQCAGLLRSQSYETVLMGTSLAANYRPVWFDTFYHTTTVKVTIPDGGLHEFDVALRYAFEEQDVKRVIFGLDPNILARSPKDAPDQLPEYLYDNNPLNDAPYLLNKDVLLRCFYALREKAAGKTQALQDAYLWDGDVYFSRELALAGYKRPEPSGTVMPSDALIPDCDANLATVTSWLKEHPDTHFVFYVSPYSILFWDKMTRLGETDAMLTMLSHMADVLLAYDNAEIQFFMDDRAVVTNLDNYADHIHVAGRVTYEMAKDMPGGKYRLTEKNKDAVLDDLRDLVVHYDYDSIWGGAAS